MNRFCMKILLGVAVALSIPLGLHADNIVFNDLTNDAT
jgi:hypothetical protein